MSREVDYEVAVATASLIRDAADIMISRGQAQGVYEDAQGRVCVLGALSRASAKRSVPSLVAGETMRALHREIRLAGHGFTTLTQWNDNHPLPTVVNVMRDAAARLERGDFE